MIRRLNYKDTISAYDFVSRIKDKYEDFYITRNKQRVFLTNLSLINNLLKYQEVYAVDNGEIRALLIILKEKGFRTYIKVLAEENDYIYDLLKFLNWNFNTEFFIKAKKYNPLVKIAQQFFFNFIGDRGTEILLIKKRREIKNDKHINKT